MPSELSEPSVRSETSKPSETPETSKPSETSESSVSSESRGSRSIRSSSKISPGSSMIGSSTTSECAPHPYSTDTTCPSASTTSLPHTPKPA